MMTRPSADALQQARPWRHGCHSNLPLAGLVSFVRRVHVRVFICTTLLAVLTCGCDWGGLRRVHLRLYSPNTQTSSISPDPAETQEALRILEPIVLRHGFRRADNAPGCIRTYEFARSPVTVEERTYTRTIPCHVWLTRAGILVTFDEFGFLAAKPEAEGLFVDVRDAFIARYGKRNVKAHRLGNPMNCRESDPCAPIAIPSVVAADRPKRIDPRLLEQTDNPASPSEEERARTYHKPTTNAARYPVFQRARILAHGGYSARFGSSNSTVTLTYFFDGQGNLIGTEKWHIE